MAPFDRRPESQFYPASRCASAPSHTSPDIIPQPLKIFKRTGRTPGRYAVPAFEPPRTAGKADIGDYFNAQDCTGLRDVSSQTSETISRSSPDGVSTGEEAVCPPALFALSVPSILSPSTRSPTPSSAYETALESPASSTTPRIPSTSSRRIRKFLPLFSPTSPLFLSPNASSLTPSSPYDTARSSPDSDPTPKPPVPASRRASRSILFTIRPRTTTSTPSLPKPKTIPPPPRRSSTPICSVCTTSLSPLQIYAFPTTAPAATRTILGLFPHIAAAPTPSPTMTPPHVSLQPSNPPPSPPPPHFCAQCFEALHNLHTPLPPPQWTDMPITLDKPPACKACERELRELTATERVKRQASETCTSEDAGRKGRVEPVVAGVGGGGVKAGARGGVSGSGSGTGGGTVRKVSLGVRYPPLPNWMAKLPGMQKEKELTDGVTTKTETRTKTVDGRRREVSAELEELLALRRRRRDGPIANGAGGARSVDELTLARTRTRWMQRLPRNDNANVAESGVRAGSVHEGPVEFEGGVVGRRERGNGSGRRWRAVPVHVPVSKRMEVLEVGKRGGGKGTGEVWVEDVCGRVRTPVPRWMEKLPGNRGRRKARGV